MQITSTNLSKPTTITWNGKTQQTGIFKTPTNMPIFLGKSGVQNDAVIDRKYHGGEFKACYLFSENQYGYWQDLYPNLDWDWGMFGENLTVKNLDETKIYVGDIYKIGNAIVQITEPREPCFKLGIRFGSQSIIKQFIEHSFPGTYIRIIEEGTVEKGDVFQLIEKNTNSLTTAELFKLIISKEKNQNHLKLAINNEALPPKKRQQLEGFLK
ncbi:MOSC domain-containing protein [Flavobacteriaceae bacterium GSB9]|nr:MOSC domain-containing protein [Flavobacteriaceae bacterium GSB9]